MKTICHITPINLSDIYSIIEISDKQLGKDYLTKKDLQDYIDHPSYLNIKTTIENKITGFSIAQICSVVELKNMLLEEKKWLTDQFKDHEPVFYRKITCVDPRYEEMGIAHKLVEHSLKRIQSKVKSILSVCWKKNGVVPFGKILENFDFHILKEIPNYWKKDSLNKQYKCEICGDPPCRCSAVIYAKFESW